MNLADCCQCCRTALALLAHGYVKGLTEEIPGAEHSTNEENGTYKQGWAKLVLIALERYSVELKRSTFNFR